MTFLKNLSKNKQTPIALAIQLSSLFCFIFLFHAYLIKLYRRLVVDPILNEINKVDTFVIIGVVIALIITLFLLIHIGRRRILIHSRISMIFLVYTACYIITRRYEGDHFLTLIGRIKVADLTLLPMLLIVESTLIKIFAKKHLITGIGYFHDDPLNADVKGYRSDLAVHIASRIIATKNEKSSFAFGLTGDWGSGKTTMLNLLKNEFAKYKKQCDVLEFNPWQVEDANLITKEFFKTLGDHLNKSLVGLKADINDYADTLIQNDKNILSAIAGKMFSLFRNDGVPLEDKYLNVQTGIKAIGKKIIILIDDVDRLQEAEILEVLKLIRNSASFGNLIFIVAFDYDHVEQCLAITHYGRAGKYLEKIFQSTVMMNPYRSEELRSNLAKKLSNILTESDYEYITSDQYSSMYQFPSYEKGLKNMRDVVRFTNLIINYYPLFHERLFFPDLYRMLFIRLLYPKAFHIIGSRKEKYFTTFSPMDGDHQLLSLVRKNADGNAEYEYESKINLQSKSVLFEDLLKMFSTDTASLISYLVQTIFSDPVRPGRFFDSTSSKESDKDFQFDTDIRSTLSIRLNMKFDEYFDIENFGLLHREFLEAFSQSQSNLKDQVTKWYDNGWGGDFEFKIDKIIRFPSKDYFKNVLLSLVIASETPEETEFSKLTYLRSLISGKILINTSLERSNLSNIFSSVQEFEGFVINFLTENIHHTVVYYATEDLLRPEKLRREGKFIFNQAQLLSILLNNFEHTIDAGSIIDDSFLCKLYVIWRLADTQNLNLDLIHNKIKERIIAPDLDTFIVKILRRDRRDRNQYDLNVALFSIFNDSYEELRTFIDDNKNAQSVYSLEFIAFLERVIPFAPASSFSFEFKKIPILELEQFLK